MFNDAFVRIQGRLGKDPEIRTTQKGGQIVTLSVGVNKRKKDPKTNEYISKAQWFDVAVIRPQLVERAKKAKKGAHISLNGELEKEEYLDKNQNSRVATKIVLLEDNSSLSFFNKNAERAKSSTH